MQNGIKFSLNIENNFRYLTKVENEVENTWKFANIFDESHSSFSRISSNENFVGNPKSNVCQVQRLSSHMFVQEQKSKFLFLILGEKIL